MHIVRHTVRTLEVEKVNLLQSSGVCSTHEYCPRLSVLLKIYIFFTLILYHSSAAWCRGIFPLPYHFAYYSRFVFFIGSIFLGTPCNTINSIWIPDTFCQETTVIGSQVPPYMGELHLGLSVKNCLTVFVDIFVESVLQFGIQHVCLVPISIMNSKIHFKLFSSNAVGMMNIFSLPSTLFW